MARSFSAASSQRLTGSVPVTSYPFTLAAWAKCTDATNYRPFFSVGVSSGAVMGRLSFRGDLGGDPVQASAANSGVGEALSTAGFSTSGWNHICGVFSSNSSRTIYLNGGNNATNTTSMTAFTPDIFRLGSDPTDGNFLDGQVAEACVWSVALTSTEVSALATGISPRMVRPEALVGYWPLIDNDGDVDWWGQRNLSAVNSPTYATHPPVIYPGGVL